MKITFPLICAVFAIVSAIAPVYADEPAAEPAPAINPWGFNVAAESRYMGGNSEGKTAGLNAEANYVRPRDFSVKLYGAARYNKTDGKVSEHNASGGADTELFLPLLTGVYVREELSTDRVNDIRLRSTFAAGGEYFIFKHAVPGGLEMLRLRAGFGHRYEKHRGEAAASSSDITLDFGARLHKRLSDVFAWTTEITYTPAVDDFADYRVSHDSHCAVDLISGWRVSQEFGVLNEYNSHPAGDNKKLDTTVYFRIKKTW